MVTRRVPSGTTSTGTNTSSPPLAEVARKKAASPASKPSTVTRPRSSAAMTGSSRSPPITLSFAPAAGLPSERSRDIS